MTPSNVHIWRPLAIFAVADEEASAQRRAFILLNRPIDMHNGVIFRRLWLNTRTRLCTDGAANRLLDWTQRQETTSDTTAAFTPDYICGDMDSIRDDVAAHYKRLGSKCMLMTDQNETDFAKTLKFTITELEEKKRRIATDESSEVYVLSEYSGRLDHGLSILHTLYTVHAPSVRIYLMGGQTATFLCLPGLNVIYVDDDVCGQYCGIFAFGNEAHVSTHGLKYNLNDRVVSFQGFVSSSNEFASDDTAPIVPATVLLEPYDKARKHCCIQTDEPVLFTMSINT